MHVLSDLDGPVADWNTTWDLFLDTHYSHLPDIPRSANQTSFDLKAGRTPEESAAIDWIMDHPDFYDALEPVPGAAEALNEMAAQNHLVHIVTSPWHTNPNCASAKLRWVEKHVGRGWAKRTVITHDKTLVRGDILIDDRPRVEGALKPTWSHILFDAPHNHAMPLRESTARTRMAHWDQWPAVIATSEFLIAQSRMPVEA